MVWGFTDNAGTFTVKRSTTHGRPYVDVVNNLIGTNYIDTGVINNTTYYYVVTAANAGAESVDSAEVSATR